MIQKLADNLYTFPINFKRSPLGWLNCYVFKGVKGGRDLLVDSGFNIPHCLEELKAGMKRRTRMRFSPTVISTMWATPPTFRTWAAAC